MVGFVVYDLVFLGLFVVAAIFFLSTGNKNLHRQGILYLYKTKVGVNFIDKFAKKFEKILKPVQYLVIISGYALMIGILWLLIKTTYIYLKFPIEQLIRAPPIAPLIPYFPKIFGLESFLPPLYFTYFIIALAIVAVAHEFSHGIFARLHKFKIHSTGFAFLGPILGAFVEPDEKQMQKAKRFPQMVVLGAGTFANIIMAVIFGAILILFFTSFFFPAGIKFNNYAVSGVQTSQISVIGNSSISENLLEIEIVNPEQSASGKIFFVRADALQRSLEKNISTIFVFDNSPAFRAQLRGAITEINGNKITSIEELNGVLQSYNSGDNVTIKTAVLDTGKETVAETREYTFELGERDGKTYLGVIFISNKGDGFMGVIYDLFTKVKVPSVFYKSSLGDFGWFIYYLIWWIVVINFFVALFNMLPLGILDGGRFFYLTILGVTKNEGIARRAYKFMMWFLLAILVVLMAKWFKGFF